MATTIELARKLAALGETSDAQRAYCLAIQESNGQRPEEELEASIYLLQSGGDHRIAYTCMQNLYRAGHFRQECLGIMTEAFYLPNVKPQQLLYAKNCKALQKYPYLFRKDFPEFTQLPIRFYPFDDNGFVPFDIERETFGTYVNFNHPVVSRNFFQNLDNPILARDVYSQYELSYLHDTVRKSEWVGRENHIYLHYTSWETFCAYLQCIDFRPLLKEEKLVFLFGDEVSQYPIDFQARFGIDYTKYPVKPVGIREINRLIWHTQLSAHNGGDFFNEIFHGHPNLLAYDSVMYDSLIELVNLALRKLKVKQITEFTDLEPRIASELIHMRNPTQKDVLVALFLGKNEINGSYDRASRIVPAIFFQPHFHNIRYQMTTGLISGVTTFYSEEYESIRTSPMFQGFRYIKTFTPMRRFTTSYAASTKFNLLQAGKQIPDAKGIQKYGVVGDNVTDRLLNRSFMVDWQDRLYMDSILVRFEDGKLNPKATFTALAAFLDLPYTESMTYCSSASGINPETFAGNARGFDPVTVYRTYDEYADDADRAFLEYFFRDAYAYYGYDFHYYKGEPVDEAWIDNAISHFTKLDGYIMDSWEKSFQKWVQERLPDDIPECDFEDGFPETARQGAEKILNKYLENRKRLATLLMGNLRFVNKQGQPLRFMKKLELDPTLLEQPLYH